jgi:outer membrane protein assembly factor BamB
MYEPDPPFIANGIVFGDGTGADTNIGRDDVPYGTPAPTVVRGSQTTHATLHALDGLTGRELWSSDDQMTSYNHQSGLTVANGKVYVGTYDGMEYCFGIQK